MKNFELVTAIFFVFFTYSRPSFANCENALKSVSQRASFLKQDLRVQQEKKLWKSTPALVKTSNLSDQFKGFSWAKKISVNNSLNERFHAIADYPIENIIIAPGHQSLRSPNKINGLANYIADSSGGDFAKDPMTLNLITDSDGKIKFVDIWDGHHRLIAYLQLEKKKISEIGSDNLRILVNGHDSQRELFAHWLPAHGIDLEFERSFSHVPDAKDISTLSLDGRRSNYELGSRSSAKQLYKNMKKPKKKVAIYLNPFHSIDDNHLLSAKKAMEKNSFDEVVFIPEDNSKEKIELLKRLLENQEKYNLYVGDSSPWREGFEEAVFMKHISNLYGTTDVYIIRDNGSAELFTP